MNANVSIFRMENSHRQKLVNENVKWQPKRVNALKINGIDSAHQNEVCVSVAYGWISGAVNSTQLSRPRDNTVWNERKLQLATLWFGIY